MNGKVDIQNMWAGTTTRMGRFSKRTFDILLSALGLLLLSPLFVIVALRIKSYSPGPVFYRGPRMGKGGKIFSILKFRTMYETPESYNGPRITARDDQRITPVGRWLRDTKLNELPQLWNVLKGDMSLVGPRPEDPLVVETWPPEMRQEILSVRPGVTSPASVLYRDEEKLLQSDSVMDKYLSSILPSKLRLDQLYVLEHRFLGDLDIIFLTFIALLPNLRKQEFPEQLLFWGPLARFRSRHFDWFLADALVAFFAVSSAGILWRSTGPLDLGWGPAALMAIGIGLLFGIVNAALGLNRIAWSQARPSDALSLVLSGGFTTLLTILLNRLIPAWIDLPIGMWALASLLAILGFIATRYRLRLLTGLATRWLSWRGVENPMGERTLVIGAGQMAQFTIQLLRQSRVYQALHIVGLVDDDPRKHGLHINGHTVLGTTQDIPQLVREMNVGLLLFSIGKISPKKTRTVLAKCHQSGARLVRIPNVYELFSACLLEPQEMSQNVVSADWDGHVPIPVVINWLLEMESLAEPGNTPLITRMREVRNALAVHMVNEATHE